MELKGKEKRNAQQSKYGMHNSGKEITINEQLSTNSISSDTSLQSPYRKLDGSVLTDLHEILSRL